MNTPNMNTTVELVGKRVFILETLYAVLGGADPASLQQVRNEFGPSWLVRFSLKAAVRVAHA